MIRSEWNALQRGDTVEVHHPAFPVRPTTSGHVVSVTVRSREVNDLAIRLHTGDERVIRPPLTTVHRPRPPRGTCWRCVELERSAPGAADQ